MKLLSISATTLLVLTNLAVAEPASLPGKIQNVLFLISDDLKASVLPAYGNTVCKTPNLDRLAASGKVFERAYCRSSSPRPVRSRCGRPL